MGLDGLLSTLKQMETLSQLYAEKGGGELIKTLGENIG
jgi:hypothetical protein